MLGAVSGAGAAGVYVKSTAASARATIAESDPITVSIRGVPSVGEGNAATYTVFISGGTPTADLTVSYATEDGTATADSDYTAVPETSLTFTSTNHAGKTVTVQTTDDTLTEPDETFTVTLSAPSGGGGPAPVLDVNGTSVETTIEDDDVHIGDPPPINDPPEESTVISLSLEPVYILESAGATEVTVTATHKFGVTLASDVTVNLTWGGTATQGSTDDYTVDAALTSITIPAGQVSASDTLTITPIDDDVMEDDETITVRGSVETTDSEEEVLVGSAQTVIVDDDEDITLTVSELSLDPDRILENDPKSSYVDVKVTATLKGDTLTSDKTVNLELRGTASSPDDYTAKALRRVTIPAGSKSGSGTLRITPFNDELIEGNETIVVSGKATDLTVKPAVITIVDDDRALLSITGPSSMDEGSNRVFTITLSANYGKAVIVPWRAKSITADPRDYSPPRGHVVFPANSRKGDTQPFTITATDDDEQEEEEKFTLELESITDNQESPVAVDPNRNSVTTTINDNDDPPGGEDTTGITLSVNPLRVGENEGATEFTVTAALGVSRTSPTVVSLTVGDEGSTAGSSDYTITKSLGSVTIPANSSSGSGTLIITPTDDAEVEGDETIVVSGTTAADLSGQPGQHHPDRQWPHPSRRLGPSGALHIRSFHRRGRRRPQCQRRRLHRHPVGWGRQVRHRGLVCARIAGRSRGRRPVHYLGHGDLCGRQCGERHPDLRHHRDG